MAAQLPVVAGVGLADPAGERRGVAPGDLVLAEHLEELEVAELAGGHADGTWTRRLRELARPAVLVLDDFAMRELTPAQADDLYELINERSGRSLILTSNRSPVDWYPLFPNPVVAESLLDRLINNSHQLFMNGASYRPHKRPGRVAPQDTTTPR